MKLPVVRIVNEKKDGFVEINEKDFDKAKHELYKEIKEDKKKKVAKKAQKKRIKKEEK